MKPLLPSLTIIVALAGCATQEYRNAEAFCRPAAYQQYPVIYQQRWESRMRPVEVFTGRTRCVNRDLGNGRSESVCEPLREIRYVESPVLVTVDLNEIARDTVISACAQDSCMRQFGNIDCKSGR